MGTTHELHERALTAAKNFRRSEAELIEALIAVEKEKVFRALSYSSLFQYAHEALGLSEAVAYALIAVARKSFEVPELPELIASGDVSVSKVTKVISVLTPETQDAWIPKLKTLSTRELEREVAKEQPQPLPKERVKVCTPERSELKLGISEELLQKLRRAQDLVSQSQGKAATLEDTLTALVDFYLPRKDPVQKAERAQAMKAKPEETTAPVQTASSTLHVKSSTTRAPIPAAVKHQVYARDKGRCQERLPSGALCGKSRWTDMHHRTPVYAGGTNAPENLVTLCRGHHRAHHSEG